MSAAPTISPPCSQGIDTGTHGVPGWIVRAVGKGRVVMEQENSIKSCKGMFVLLKHGCFQIFI